MGAKITLVHGDCYKILKTLDVYDYKKVAIITDPPYELDTQGAGAFGGRKYYADILEKGINNGFDFSIFGYDWVHQVICFCSRKQRLKLENYLSGLFHRVEQCRWYKMNPMPVCHKNYLPDYEPWFHAWQKGSGPEGDAGNLHTYIMTKVGGKSGYDHPTVKPVQVMRKAMQHIDADLIIDPFMGTGTTGEVAHSMGIDFIGIEIDKDFYDIAAKRLGKALSEDRLL